ncbi:hypothetical protein ACN38_g9772 [Penicillium nordicum]|uniref:Uncharacterized protein n=1 Tax=Penicillium nordicum TaxID=229535 RepID=A0A0M8P322_9EURO|nr:hypothetical protein ACN38_g9772 [Penicillium nordicum]
MIDSSISLKYHRYPIDHTTYLSYLGRVVSHVSRIPLGNDRYNVICEVTFPLASHYPLAASSSNYTTNELPPALSDRIMD